eukprot:4537067-Prymnesium_polylepis.1
MRRRPRGHGGQAGRWGRGAGTAGTRGCKRPLSTRFGHAAGTRVQTPRAQPGGRAMRACPHRALSGRRAGAHASTALTAWAHAST